MNYKKKPGPISECVSSVLVICHFMVMSTFVQDSHIPVHTRKKYPDFYFPERCGPNDRCGKVLNIYVANKQLFGGKKSKTP